MRRTRVMSLAYEPPRATPQPVEANSELILKWLDRSTEFQPDFVCFAELCLQRSDGALADWIRSAETIPGPALDRICRKAEECRTHVILPMLERTNSGVHNSAVLIGPDGRVIGTYRKNYPPIPELEAGFLPGKEVPVWETAHGRVGMAICFDLEFPDVGLALSRAQADIVFWPSLYEGGRKLSAWAMSYGFCVVSCCPSSCVVVDMNGEILTRGTGNEPFSSCEGLQCCAFAELNTDQRVYHLDYNEKRIAHIRAAYGDDVSIEVMQPENLFILRSETDSVTVGDIEREFTLEPLRHFLDRSMRMREERR